MKTIIKNALKEDWGRGDLYGKIAKSSTCKAVIISKDIGIFAGAKWLKILCKTQNIKLTLHVKDGQKIKYGAKIATLKGSSKKLLKCERVALNGVQHISGIATKTNQMARKLRGFTCRLLDTRKTRPNLRALEKYAVMCGGGANHRMGLDDCLMIKDTHLATIKNIDKFLKQARAKIPFTCKIEIECESAKQAKAMMKKDVDIIMLDNMSTKNIKNVVEYRDKKYPHIKLEASGNISECTIKKYAKTGVDAISSGSLVHQAVWLDFSMKMDGA